MSGSPPVVIGLKRVSSLRASPSKVIDRTIQGVAFRYMDVSLNQYHFGVEIARIMMIWGLYWVPLFGETAIHVYRDRQQCVREIGFGD